MLLEIALQWFVLAFSCVMGWKMAERWEDRIAEKTSQGYQMAAEKALEKYKKMQEDKEKSEAS